MEEKGFKGMMREVVGLRIPWKAFGFVFYGKKQIFQLWSDMILLIFHRTILTEVGKIVIVDRNRGGKTRKSFYFIFYSIIYLVIQYILFMIFPSSNSSQILPTFQLTQFNVLSLSPFSLKAKARNKNQFESNKKPVKQKMEKQRK